MDNAVARTSECTLLASRPNIVSLAYVGTIQVDKNYKVVPFTTFQILMTLKLLLNLRANLIAINELANLNFSTCSLSIKLKKRALGIKLLQNLPNGTKLLQRLRNSKKLLQVYRME